MNVLIILIIEFFSICRRYDEMADTVSDISDQTKNLVETQEYLKNVSLGVGMVEGN